MGSSAFALVLTLALAGCINPAERKCLLSGSWRSNTGCRMVVSVLGKDGSFSGSYLPGPAAGNSEILSSPLEGSQQDAGLVSQPTFSFTVRWRLRGSETARTTAFLGQCYPLLCQAFLYPRLEKGEVPQDEAWQDREGEMGLSPVTSRG
ncbi:PREDICTED: avidin-like [Fulmarus glacialis]|uniref:avidin-like n=1 Tax=Fulmarus glacialis TaxID=30455 RepID=UPI00051C5DBD|nr:PREDICTED: avidin-like [Fulmarus glacialis]